MKTNDYKENSQRAVEAFFKEFNLTIKLGGMKMDGDIFKHLSGKDGKEIQSYLNAILESYHHILKVLMVLEVSFYARKNQEIMIAQSSHKRLTGICDDVLKEFTELVVEHSGDRAESKD